MNLLLDIVTTAAILYAVALGLLIVFGVMGIISFAHGAMLTVGGYAALLVTQAGGNPWLSLPAAALAGMLAGAAMEWAVLRPLYRRPLDAILATWGLGIVIGQVITLVFGRQVQFAQSPLSGAATVLGETYSQYRLLLVLVAAVLGGVIALVLHGTRLGLVTRAVIANENLAQSLGVNSARVRFASFSLGSALASLAGALVVPLSSVDPNMGVPWLVAAFMLVLLSGSSLVSMAAAAIVLGAAQVLVSTYLNAVLGGMTIAILAAVILRIRPTGFARA
ncbi:MAG TPA: branched-chain amino acid ABC transporter permease [Acetobacteraceae bacterium]